MDIDEIITNSRLFEAIKRSKHFKDFRAVHIKSGRFSYLDRFTKFQNFLLESLYTVNDLPNPSAFRIYLYLLRQITGYKNRSSIEFNVKKIQCQLNMKNSFYRAVDRLKDKNMIYFTYRDGIKYIGLNPIPESWGTDNMARIDEIMRKETNAILGISDQDLMSSSSSSWSSSSSSSISNLIDDDLLEELDNM